MKFLLVVCGPFRDVVLKEHGDFAYLLSRAVTSSSSRELAESLELEQIHLYDDNVVLPEDLSSYSGIFLSGSRYNVTERQPWSINGAAWLKRHIRQGDAATPEVPIFAICYGHQLVCTALGGAVDWNPKGPEWGTFTADPTEHSAADPLLQRAGIAGRPFLVSAYHNQTVTVAPAESKCLAVSQLDDHQILRHGSLVYSTQFHPEFYPDLFRTYAPCLGFASEEKRTEFLSTLKPTIEAANLVSQFVVMSLELHAVRNTIPRHITAGSTIEEIRDDGELSPARELAAPADIACEA